MLISAGPVSEALSLSFFLQWVAVGVAGPVRAFGNPTFSKEDLPEELNLY